MNKTGNEAIEKEKADKLFDNFIEDYFREKKMEDIKKDPFFIEYDKSEKQNKNNSDESKKLLPIIFSLPKKYGNIILLSDIYGLKHKVISEQFNLSLSCVKTRVVRGRKLSSDKMKECCNFTHDKYGNIIDCSEKKEYLENLKNLKKNTKDLPLSVSSSDNK